MGVATKTIILGGTVAITVVARSAFPMDGLTEIARREIPPSMVSVYKSAATRCIGLPWQVLAAIGWVESRHANGTADPDTGETPAPIVGPPLDGTSGSRPVLDPSQADGWARPLGPMGLLPSAWERYATVAPGRPTGATPSVQNAWDAAHATAEELCGEAPVLGDLNRALRMHSPRPFHVMETLLKAARYGSGDGLPDVEALVVAISGEARNGSGGTSAARAAIDAALTVLGTPYVWGAESPEEGFDCSGLVWWAFGRAGIALPRTTGGQVGAGLAVGTDEILRPGDLLFTRGGQQVHDLGHVAIYAGAGLEVVAPRSGKSVTVQKVDIDRVQAVRRILPAP